MSNFYPSIPDPQNNTESVAESVRALKMAVETMAGQRDGGAATRIFTQKDEPKGPKDGDTWLDPTDAGRIRIWNGHFWVDVSDSRFSVLEKAAGEASALIKELSEIRVTDSEAFARKLTELEARFGENFAKISDELRVRVTATEALAQRVTSLSADFQSNGANTSALIKEEATARATADDAEATKRSNLSAYVGYTDGQSYTKTLAASVDDEQTARVAADSAIAQAVTSVSAGASRVYTQSSAPSSAGRVQGDVWYDTANNFTPYVWYNGSWQNNSSGAYTKYVGEVATLTQSLTTTKTATDNLTYEYRLQGSFGTTTLSDGSSFTGIQFTGGRQRTGTDANGNPVYDTASNILLAANTIKLDGNVIITGSVNTGQIANNAISDSGVGFGNGSATTSVMSRAVDDAFLVVATYAGGDSNAVAGINGYLQIKQNGTNIGTGAPITGFATGGVSSTFVGSTNQTWGGFLALNYTTGSVTTVARVPAGAANSAITFSATTGLSAPVAIYVIRLAR